MKVTIARIALGAILLSFAAAEIGRPTTFVAKKSAHAPAAGESIGQQELDDLPPIVKPAMGKH
jgi:hypothetical protein